MIKLRFQRKKIFGSILIILNLFIINSVSYAICGDGNLEAGEECDLGSVLNTGEWGCTNLCKKVAGWDCTTTVGAFKIKEGEAQNWYNQLVPKQAEFDTNNCKLYNAGTKEVNCYSYQELLRQFRELNQSIPVDCTQLNVTQFKQRPPTSSAPQPTNYVVKCNP
jgi:hypothetical protein